MNIQKLKHNRTLMTVLQGLLLLVILSTLFSVCINLLLTGFSDDVIALNEQMADQQTVSKDDHEQKAAERLEALSEATTELEKYTGGSFSESNKYGRRPVLMSVPSHSRI